MKCQNCNRTYESNAPFYVLVGEKQKVAKNCFICRYKVPNDYGFIVPVVLAVLYAVSIYTHSIGFFEKISAYVFIGLSGLLISWLSTAFHELGHFVACRIFKFPVTHIIIGSLDRGKSFKVNEVDIRLSLFISHGMVIYQYSKTQQYNKKHFLWLYLSGPLVNLVLGLCAVLLLWMSFFVQSFVLLKVFVGMACFINLYLFIFNIWPRKMPKDLLKNPATDGAVIKSILTDWNTFKNFVELNKLRIEYINAFESGNYQVVHKIAERLFNGDEPTVDDRFNFALSLYLNERYEESEKLYSEILEEPIPEIYKGMIYNNLSSIYLSKMIEDEGEYIDKCEELLFEATKRMQSESNPTLIWCFILYYRQRYQNALDILNEIDLEKQKPVLCSTFFVCMAICYRALNDMESYELYLLKAKENFSENPIFEKLNLQF